MERSKKNILLWKLVLIIVIFVIAVILLELNFISKKTELTMKIKGKNLNSAIAYNDELDNIDDKKEEKPYPPEEEKWLQPENVGYTCHLWMSNNGMQWNQIAYSVGIQVYLNKDHVFNKNDDETRYYAKVSSIEKYYKMIGFENNSSIIGKNIFVTNKTEKEWYNLYAGSGIVNVGGENYFPLNTVEEAGKDNKINIFYFPNSSYTEKDGVLSYYDETVWKKESIYYIDVWQNTSLIATYYVPAGRSFNIDLNKAYGASDWELADIYDIRTKITDGILKIDSVNCGYNIYMTESKNYYYITYNSGTENGVTIEGKGTSVYSEKIDIENINNYELLDLSRDYIVDNFYGGKNTYIFDGWIINNANYDKIKPGETFTQEQLDTLVNGNTIYLIADWKLLDEDDRVNFFLDLTTTYTIDDLGNMHVNTDRSYFTESQYVTKLEKMPSDLFDYIGTKENSKYFSYLDSLNQYIISDLYNESRDYDEKMNKRIRNLSEEGFNLIPGDEKSKFKLKSFPTDDEIFENIRNEKDKYSIHIDGKTMDIKNLTSDNFFIDWYVVKFQAKHGDEKYCDAWHVDGRIVLKTDKKDVLPDEEEKPPKEDENKPQEKPENKPEAHPVENTPVIQTENNPIINSILPNTGIVIIPIIVCVIVGTILIIYGNVLNKKPKRKMHKY